MRNGDEHSVFTLIFFSSRKLIIITTDIAIFHFRHPYFFNFCENILILCNILHIFIHSLLFCSRIHHVAYGEES